eukprot:GHVS01040067.1.p1 GENE.GHVS01040067.1~~GHVS01040067.1.p1  ORF type:complete len:338 (-),score=33.20 GHVS01040067.1:176-1189(-)
MPTSTREMFFSLEDPRGKESAEVQIVDVFKVVDLVRKASEAIMKIYTIAAQPPQGNGAWLDKLGGISMKTDETTGTVSPLTVADLEANKIICDGLRELTPEVPIVTEEESVADFDSVRKHYRYYWVVDPLDGTKEFIKRSGEFTVNVGLCYLDSPVMGVVMVPVTGAIYYSALGKGAFKIIDPTGAHPENGSNQAETCVPMGENIHSYLSYNSVRIKVLSFREDDEGLTCVASTSHKSTETIQYLERFKNCKLTCMGSSLKLLLVAEGKAHVYPRLAPTCEWDTCAAHAIVKEAGGETYQLSSVPPYDTLGPLLYNKPNTLNPWFVVVGKRTAAATS